MKEISLAVVMPIYNEEAALPDLLDSTSLLCKSRGWRLILVDDGSTDRTSDILSNYQNMNYIDIVKHSVNRGYGGALRSGILMANTEYVVTMDADGQHTLAHVDTLLEFAESENADLVVGSRTRGDKSSLYRRLGKWLIRVIVNAMVKLPVEDINSGFKLYRTKVARRFLPLCPDSMAFSDVMTLACIKHHCKVVESHVPVEDRKGGNSTINTYTAVETVYEIMNLIMLLDPMRIFLPLSLLAAVAGICWGLFIIIDGRGVSAGTLLALLTGLLLFILGLIASQLSAIRLALIHNENKQSEHI